MLSVFFFSPPWRATRAVQAVKQQVRRDSNVMNTPHVPLDLTGLFVLKSLQVGLYLLYSLSPGSLRRA